MVFPWSHPYELTVLTLLVSLWATGHILLFKREARAAVAWIGLVWALPLFGAAIYAIIGINLIQRKAAQLRPGVQKTLEPFTSHDGAIEMFKGGDEAYPAMLAAIDSAVSSVELTTYIFDRDEVGLAFVEHLARAQARGVEVRVIVDDVGSRYSMPTIIGPLRKAGIPHRKFLPTFFLWNATYVNLRNHRKALLIDAGHTERAFAFLGGMNLRVGHWISRNPRSPIFDMMFRVSGPAVQDLRQVFEEDWAFTSSRSIPLNRKEPTKVLGESLAPRPLYAAKVRVIPDGPDANQQRLKWTFLRGLTSAEKTVSLVTPYFLPDSALMAAINVAALKGVDVRIYLPRENNLPWVGWAAQSQLWQLAAMGCKIFYTAPPFDHTKALLIDGVLAYVGSSNWDARSLRLNFELNLEVRSHSFGAELAKHIRGLERGAEEMTLERLDARSLFVRLRDGFFRLFSPYL